MSLLPESASFEERVVDCFLALRGRGLDISPLDRPVLEAWAASGAPFEVIARGLRLATEKALFDLAPGEPPLRSMRACRRTVDAEIRRHLKASAGAHSSGEDAQPDRSWELKRSAALLDEASGWAQARIELAPAIAHAKDVLSSAPADLSYHEDLLSLLILRALPFAERRGLWRRANGDGEWVSSAAARRLARRTRLLSGLRAALG